MKNLQEATERICELKGSLVALDALVPAIIDALSQPARATLMASFDAHAEAARTVMLHADISDVVLATFERDVARDRAVLLGSQDSGTASEPAPAVDGLLMATTRIAPFAGPRALAPATGFFFRRVDRLFLVSDRRTFAGSPRAPAPDRVEIRLHTDPQDLARTALLSLTLHRAGRPQWREATPEDARGGLALLEIPREALPADVALQAFDASHLASRDEVIALGDPLTVVGFHDDCHDTLNHLAVARGAWLASAFGVRYRGQRCFLAESRSLAGATGSPVVRRRTVGATGSPSPAWQLLGVHAGGLGDEDGDDTQAEKASTGAAPGLDRAWYADPLLALTAEA